MKKKGMIIQKAEEYVIETDEKRNKMILSFLDKKPQAIDYLFDSTLNRSSFSIDQLSALILDMYESKLGKIK